MFKFYRICTSKSGQCKFKIFLEKNSLKLRENAQNLNIFGDRLYRWVADYNRPINRSFFRRLIGRLIGIGRTLLRYKEPLVSKEEGIYCTVGLKIK